MVDTVAEPDLLHIFFKSLEVFGITVTFVISVDPLEQGAYRQVVPAILIPDYIAAYQCCLVQIIDHGFACRGQFLEPGYFVTEHFDIGEPVYHIIEVFVFGAMCRKGHNRA